MYDVQDDENHTARAGWVPRMALKRVPESQEEASLRKYEAIWVHQIRRQRAADERKRKYKGERKNFYYNFDLARLESDDPSFTQRRESAQKLLGRVLEILA